MSAYLAQNAQLADKTLKTCELVMEVDHTNKAVDDLGTLVKTFALDALTLNGAEFEGEIRKVLSVEDLSGTTTGLTAVLEADGDVLVTIDASATIRLTYLLK